jgi:cytochrome P450
MTQTPRATQAGGALPRFFAQMTPDDPFPLLAQLRAQGPVVALPGRSRSGGTTWMVTRYAEVLQVLKDQRFTVDATSVFPNLGAFGQTPGTARDTASDNFLAGRTMISVDGDNHTRLRNLVSQGFTPRYVETLRPRIQQLAEELLDRVQDQRRMDLVRDYAYPLPINVISDMLGIPADMRTQLRDWSAAITGDGTGDYEARRARVRAFSEYVSRLVAQKRQAPGDDLISHLIRAEQGGDRLDQAELLATVGLLIFAGHETTSNLIGIGTLMLLDHPGALAQLRENPDLVPSAVEELLRFNGPVLSPAPRFATDDVEVGGQRIQRGDLVLVVLASANRDEHQFSDPDDLQVARKLNQHVAFGQGVHYCLGAPLARLEGDIAFRTLLRRMPDLALAIPRDSVQWRGGLSLRGLTSLPVAF